MPERLSFPRAEYQKQGSGHKFLPQKEADELIIYPLEQTSEYVVARFESVGDKQIRQLRHDYSQRQSAVLEPDRSLAHSTNGDRKETKKPRASGTIHAAMLMRYAAIAEQSTAVYNTVIEMIKLKVERIARRVRVWWDRRR